MHGTPEPRCPFLPTVILGAVAWLALAAGFLFGWLQLDVVELLFLLAPWVVVPLAISLIPLLDGSRRIGMRLGRLSWIMLAAALLATVSFFQPAGPSAASLAGAWFLVCVWFKSRSFCSRLSIFILRDFFPQCLQG
jgi:hypothetical protein